MSADLDRLLGDTSDQAVPPADSDALWARGRRRRRVRHGVTAGAAALVLVAGGAGVTTLVDEFGGPDITSAGPAPAAPEATTGPSDEDSAVADASPLPDPSRAAEPCAGFEDRTGEAFIDVVSPVPGMHVGEQTKFIGCANVYEATVNWRVVDAAGATLRDGFVTATCGSGCVGEFSELIDLGDLPDGAVLEVFAIDAADGSDRHLVEVPVVSD